MFKIGFCCEEAAGAAPVEATAEQPREIVPRRSVVQVAFPDREQSLAYYNDRFDLAPGDVVYVEGKLEGIRGRVTEVNYNFRIRLSDYKKVIAVVDNHVHGQFFGAGSHFVTFDRSTLPMQQARSWFLPPAEEEEFATGSDDSAFPLAHLQEMGAAPKIAARGHEYYQDNRVRYLCVDGTRGYAIVEGTQPYEVEFTLRNGMVSQLVCSCFCTYPCKHEFAAMLQLNETLELIEKHYPRQFSESNFFAAVPKGILFTIAVDGHETGSLTL